MTPQTKNAGAQETGCVKKPARHTLPVMTESVRVVSRDKRQTKYALVPVCYSLRKERCPDGRSEVDEQTADQNFRVRLRVTELNLSFVVEEWT